MTWFNIYTNPHVEGEYRGNPHPTKEAADEAARIELNDENETVLVRQEERQ